MAPRITWRVPPAGFRSTGRATIACDPETMEATSIGLHPRDTRRESPEPTAILRRLAISVDRLEVITNKERGAGVACPSEERKVTLQPQEDAELSKLTIELSNDDPIAIALRSCSLAQSILFDALESPLCSTPPCHGANAHIANT